MSVPIQWQECEQCRNEPVFCAVGLREGGFDHMVQSRGDDLILVVEVMGQAARGEASFPCNIHQAEVLQPLLRDDGYGGLCKEFSTFYGVYFFWHNRYYIKNINEGNPENVRGERGCLRCGCGREVQAGDACDISGQPVEQSTRG